MIYVTISLPGAHTTIKMIMSDKPPATIASIRPGAATANEAECRCGWCGLVVPAPEHDLFHSTALCGSCARLFGGTDWKSALGA